MSQKDREKERGNSKGSEEGHSILSVLRIERQFTVIGA